MTIRKRDENDYDYDGDRHPYNIRGFDWTPPTTSRLCPATWVTGSTVCWRLVTTHDDEEEGDNNEPWFIETFASSYASNGEDVVDLTCDSE
ncbi:hypothetical protein PI125_g21889 [Phytophthora idaei]|nr:hypothetical protein PI125_g21889 [Phytophthora idaei]